MNRLKAVALLFFVIIISCFAQAQDFYLHDGDRVVFYGDSITEQKLYTNFIEAYVRTRFPNLKIEFWNSGVGGDTVMGGWAGPIDVRLKRDVLAYKPTVVTIMLGMNDGQYRALEPKILDDYTTGYKSIVQTLKRELPGVRITALEPSPFDDVTRPPQFAQGYNATMLRFGQFVREYGKEQGLTLADLNAPVVTEMRKARAWNTEAAKFIIPDRVHPGAAGHWVMAMAVLKSWNAPSIVTDVAIDASAGKVDRSVNTEVTEFQKTATGIAWTQLDKTLPLDVNTDDISAEMANRFGEIVRELNQQPLRVTGLAAGNYELRIDGKPLGRFDAKQLASGVNLALLDTPMRGQSGTLSWRVISEHNDTHSQRLRVLVHGSGSAESTQAAAYLEKVENDAKSSAREVLQLKPHKFEIVKL
jgi:lysophospholipase L1-like esterase